MKTIKYTACPMDCYDACSILYEDSIIKPNKDLITNGKLCKLFGYLQNEKNLSDTKLDKTLQTLVKKLKEPNKKILYYKGLGNLGELQAIPGKFFEKIGATFPSGGLCDEAGNAGVIMGRGYNVNPPIENLTKSEVILVWGRNLTKTSAHMYRLIKDKVFITIDPVQTEIADKSNIFLQIKPKGDFILAQQMGNYLEYKDVDIDKLQSINVEYKDFLNMMELITSSETSVMLGIGAQKYKEGAQIFHEMDKVFYHLGLLENENTGVWYIDTKAYGFNTEIPTKPTNTVPYPDVKFDDYDIVFIQGANPMVSSPNTNRIKKELQNCYVVYFGTTYNDTAQYADLIIPSKTYLQKKDVRLSYSHDQINFCEVCEENTEAISEYELTRFLFDAFCFDGLKDEDEYLLSYEKQREEKPTLSFKSFDFAEVPPIELNKNEFYLLTSKSTDTLNSQFKYDEYVYINSNCGFKENSFITISSNLGDIKLKVKHDSRVQENCLLIYAGNKEVNKLLPNIVSDYGDNACYQDIKVVISD